MFVILLFPFLIPLTVLWVAALVTLTAVLYVVLLAAILRAMEMISVLVTTLTVLMLMSMLRMATAIIAGVYIVSSLVTGACAALSHFAPPGFFRADFARPGFFLADFARSGFFPASCFPISSAAATGGCECR